MTISIEKLRKAHAATTQGEWEVAAKGDYDTDGIAIYRRNPAGLRVTVAGIRYQGTAPSMCAEPVAGFIALAHNEFPALLDELEQLRRINYQWDQVFGHLGETPDECGNAIHAEFDKRDAEIERLRAQVSEARGLLTEFERTIDNACDGDHPCADEVRAWLEENK